MESFDVIIVGGGLSGVGTACHLREKCPGKSFVILEGRERLGGTWDLFRYPGIRSDSDMHTLGFNFKPWKEAKSIADGPSILKYIKETAEEFDLGGHVRYQHMVTGASWDTKSASWVVEAKCGETGAALRFRARMLSMCSGYYSYSEWHDPEFKDRDTYQGDILHPQAWPDEYDYAGKRVLVIGSGATAMTIVPAMADGGAEVTMVQRSPTYVVSRPDQDKIANFLRKMLPERTAYALTRLKNILLSRYFYHQCMTHPEKVREKLIGFVRKHLGPDYDTDTHFSPKYNPWEQRMCLIPNADLFRTINEGKVNVVTDGIERFTEKGLRLISGQELEADIIVAATGLKLRVLGGVQFKVDGRDIDFSETFTYKGLMYSDVPNLVQTFGYINASWTLRSDLTAEYLCRLVNHMDATQVRQCTPRLREEDRGMPERSWIENFSSGYMQRSMHLFPKQSDRAPWHNPQRYALDKKMIRHGALEDGTLVFDNPAGASNEAEVIDLALAGDRKAA
ncbi:MAG: NAD(P)/FAD-dependent oxidoreductase [Gammaproteobacteria bacterium]|nr:NAD(P)/FAD-dependent oxidoreductase [Gammaproteobacteria bacterium]